MECRTASLLIEAYHDDELELVDAAHLLAHLEECPACRDRCEEAGRLRETMKTCRPVDRCPEELARRLAQRLDVRAKRRRAIPRSVTIVFAAGCGIAVGWAAVRLRTPAGRGLALASAVHRVEGEFVCLRCAMSRGLPGSRLDGTPHRPLLLTSDGRLFLVRVESPASARLEADGPARRHVAVMARLDESSGLADVMEVLPEPAAATSASAVSPAVAR
ncbi:MAG: anti-sigma factor family protein [Thermoanaerobaculia bacterium]